MLSEKQFRERAQSELRQIGNQIQSLATDRDIYRKLEREVLQPNAPPLCESRSAFMPMMRSCYADAMVARVLRLLDCEEGEVTLPRVLARLAGYPQLLHDKITETEFANDRGALERAATRLKRVAAPRLEQHERTLPALGAVHREIDAALDLMIEMVKTYYWITADGYIDLDVKYSEDPMDIFRVAMTANATWGSARRDQSH